MLKVEKIHLKIINAHGVADAACRQGLHGKTPLRLTPIITFVTCNTCKRTNAFKEKLNATHKT